MRIKLIQRDCQLIAVNEETGDEIENMRVYEHRFDNVMPGLMKMTAKARVHCVAVVGAPGNASGCEISVDIKD